MSASTRFRTTILQSGKTAMGFEVPSIYLGAAIGTALHRRFRRVFSVEDAKLLLAVGEVPNDPRLSPVDLAAGTVLAQALLNHDEAVMRR